MNRLTTHFNQLEVLEDPAKYALIAVTKTFLDATCPSATYHIDSYFLYRHDRAGRSGGGIRLYARSDLVISILHLSDPSHHDTPEHAIFLVKSSSFSLIFAIVYRRPETHLPISFLNSLANFIPVYPHVIVTGDFNINMSTTSDNSTILRRHFTEQSLHLVDSPPTHHTHWRDGSDHHTWLDLFLLKDHDRLLAYRKSSEPFTYGHDLIEIDYDLSSPPPPPLRISARKLNGLRAATVNASLACAITSHPSNITPTSSTISADAPCTTPVLSSLTPPDSLCDRITNALHTTFDQLAPVRTFTTSPNRKPWVTADIRRLMHDRRKLYNNAKRFKTPEAVEAYRDVRNAVTRDLATAKNSFLASRLNKATSVTDKWRELRKLGFGSTSLPSPLRSFSADVLNSHYASVCNAAPPLMTSDIDTACRTPTLAEPGEEFEFTTVTPNDVASALAACGSDSVGADEISTKMLQLSSPGILPHLTALCNASILSCTFPISWKKALVVPLAKSITASSPSDTRPIALLCAASKLLERVVHEQLSSYLSRHSRFDPYQSGFRAHHSTQTSLLRVLEDARIAIDKRLITILLTFDFSKAFDTVSHALLLRKLRRVGCSPAVVRWFGSYLSGRTQAVKGEGGVLSSWVSLSTGVPQGSVLGPLLFSIFISDLPAMLARAKYTVFADNLQIFQHASPTPADLVNLALRLNEDASAVVR